MKDPLALYLKRYAEPEARLAPACFDRGGELYEAVVCLPACRESALMPSCLERLASVARAAECPTLAILIVNGRENAADSTHEDNKSLLHWLATRLDNQSEPIPGMSKGNMEGLSLLVIDRASSPDRRFGQKDGVGLARKIICDVAVALHTHGIITSAWLRTTDADAQVPSDYLQSLESLDAKAAYFPFEHVGCGASYDALSQYDLYLRYYVAGLRYAGSPYAFHTIGSTIACRFDAYAAVRGFPKLLAGEDFHLLAKLAKLGRVTEIASSPIKLRDRPSDRVPFGTGAAVEKIMAQKSSGEIYHVYHPTSFELLRIWYEGLEDYLDHRDESLFRTRLALAITSATGLLAADFCAAIEAIDGFRGIRDALSRSLDRGKAKEHVRIWFDALKTLRLLHAFRDKLLPEVPLARALEAAFAIGLVKPTR